MSIFRSSPGQLDARPPTAGPVNWVDPHVNREPLDDDDDLDVIECAGFIRLQS